MLYQGLSAIPRSTPGSATEHAQTSRNVQVQDGYLSAEISKKSSFAWPSRGAFEMHPIGISIPDEG